MENNTPKNTYKTILLFSLVMVFIASSSISLIAQDPLTIDQNGNSIFYGNTTVNGNSSISGNVGIGLKLPGTSKFMISNSNSDYIDYYFSGSGMGQLQFIGWRNGWNINTKNIGKNLYLNRDSPKENDVYIGRNGKELFVDGETGDIQMKGNITAAKNGRFNNVFLGDVGLGTNWAGFSHKSSISKTGYALLQRNNGRHTLLNITSGGGYIGFRVDNVDKMVMLYNGNVGIGTNSPTRAKLQVNGTHGNNNFRYAYLVYKSNDDKTGTSGPYARYSIYANGRIACSEFNSFSDRRIKNILGISNGVDDLNTLMKIKVTDYKHKDIIEKGNKVNKKVIAQQLAEVYPQAVVTSITEVVPDIYTRAEIKNGWVDLTTDLQKGERVKLITEDETMVYEILETESTRFKVQLETQNLEAQTVFVYGREVDDFHAVDYDAIAMLNVSATQELTKQVRQLQKEKAELQAQNKNLQSSLNKMDDRLQRIEASLQTSDVVAVERN